MNKQAIKEAMKKYRTSTGGVGYDSGWKKSTERKDKYGNVIKKKNLAKHLAKKGRSEVEK